MSMQRVQQASRYADRAMSGGAPESTAPESTAPPCAEWDAFCEMMQHTSYRPENEQPVRGGIDFHEWLLAHRSTAAGAYAQEQGERMLAHGLQLRLGTVALSAATNYPEYKRFLAETDLAAKKAAGAPPSVLGPMRAQRNAMYMWVYPSRSMVWKRAQSLPRQLEMRNVAPLAHFFLTLFDFINFVTLAAAPLADAVAPPATVDSVMAQLPNGGRCALVPSRNLASADDVCVLTMTFDRELPAPEGMPTRAKSECPGAPYKLLVHHDTADFILAVYRGLDVAWDFADEFARLYGSPNVGTYDELIGHERCLPVQRAMAAKYMQATLNAISYIGSSQLARTLSKLVTPEPLAQAIAAATE